MKRLSLLTAFFAAMELYFGKPVNERLIILNEEESHHLARVKRAAVGDVIDVTDGEGFFYRARIDAIHKHQVELAVLSAQQPMESNSMLHLVIAPTKNIDRIEWLVEKATEIGVREFSFIRCRRSERKEIRIDRLEKIALSAMKQSVKAFLPKVNPMCTLPEFLDSGPSAEGRFICTMESSGHLMDIAVRGNPVTVLIGPEGDFHSDEVALAQSKGYINASLGKQRLRTETAALVSTTIINLLNK